ncbi:MAG: 3-isopropylmalate dehydratase, partial [Chloroflexota bacterium]|nr:3-isopropylmalate dehydratase [Chloroflexota bacterium]
MNFSGQICKYGDDINTDVIFPGKYTYTLRDPNEMSKHALEDLDPEFASSVQIGDIIFAGKNFGNGSSREQAVVCLKAAGVSAVIAVSFARIWYRNAINNGLAAIICPEAVKAAVHGKHAQVNIEDQTINIQDVIYSFPPFSET